jgi:hypothetical protein
MASLRDFSEYSLLAQNSSLTSTFKAFEFSAISSRAL